MALTTQCPHCGAAFKVVADQLRVRDGLVRCGVCTAVFDGRAHLQGETAASFTRAAAPAAAFQASERDTIRVPDQDAALGAVRESSQGVDFREAPMVMRTRADYPPAQSTSIDEEDADLYARDDLHTHDNDAQPTEATPDYTYAGHRDDVVYSADGVAAYHEDGPENPAGRAPAAYGEDGVVAYRVAQPDSHHDTESDTHHANHLPIFGEVRSGRAYREPQLRPSQDPDAAGVIRGEPRTRYVDDPHSGRAPPEFLDEGVTLRQQSSALGWGVACLLLLVVLLGLSTYVYRTQIATAVPALRPVLDAGCKALGCTVGYERRIERISITSSSLTPPQGAVAQEDDRQNLVLQMVLRNRFNAPQPWPAISVVLNDLSDSVVLRKTILPADYLPAELLSQPFGPNAEQRIRLPMTVSGVQVNGYQLDKFFP